MCGSGNRTSCTCSGFCSRIYIVGVVVDQNADILQLTAQALCLEEMFSAEVKEGAIFYGETRRRENILFTDELREKVKDCFCQMRQLYDKRYTPKVKWSKSCNACSLKDICVPKLGKAVSVRSYIQNAISGDEE